MKYIPTLFAVALLSGCAGFQLGGLIYCPAKASCVYQQTMELIPPAAVPVPKPAGVLT